MKQWVSDFGQPAAQPKDYWEKGNLKEDPIIILAYSLESISRR